MAISTKNDTLADRMLGELFELVRERNRLPARDERLERKIELLRRQIERMEEQN